MISDLEALIRGDGRFWFPGNYGCHARFADGANRTKTPPEGYVGKHRAEDAGKPLAP